MPRVSQSYLEARRRQIMEAAITCFAREGFHRATMQDIVAETGLSAGAIYRYFPSKEDIVAAIAAEHHAAEAAALAEAGSGGDVAAALRHLVGVSLGRLADPAEQRWRRVTGPRPPAVGRIAARTRANPSAPEPGGFARSPAGQRNPRQRHMARWVTR
jgi:AcrR family transcriptional regulator